MGRACCVSFGVIGHLMSLTSLVTTNVAEYEVHGDTVDPGGERGVATPLVEPLPHMNENVLRELGCALPRTAHPETEREDAPGVGAVQLPERVLVAGRGAPSERELAGTIVG